MCWGSHFVFCLCLFLSNLFCLVGSSHVPFILDRFMVADWDLSQFLEGFTIIEATFIQVRDQSILK